MSLLKLASLQRVVSFCFNTDATNSLVVVFPLEPPTATIGRVNWLRYAAANRPSALRVSSTVMIAQPLRSDSVLSRAATTAAAPFRFTSGKKSCPSNRSPGRAMNRSPGCTRRESVHTRRTWVCGEPLSRSPLQAATTNCNERGSIINQPPPEPGAASKGIAARSASGSVPSSTCTVRTLELPAGSDEDGSAGLLLSWWPAAAANR